MEFTKSLVNSIVLASLLSLLFVRDAHAYLDPGSGSYILQIWGKTDAGDQVFSENVMIPFTISPK